MRRETRYFQFNFYGIPLDVTTERYPDGDIVISRVTTTGPYAAEVNFLDMPAVTAHEAVRNAEGHAITLFGRRMMMPIYGSLNELLLLRARLVFTPEYQETLQ